MTSLVLKGGRVVDPGSGLDEVTDLRVDRGKVAAVGPDLEGDRVLDVSGLVVGPGFVDLHSHVHSIAGQRLQAFDGVTTALDLEAGLMPVGQAYDRAAAEGRPLHYGFSASWGQARAKVLAGIEPVADFATCLGQVSLPAWQRTSSLPERDAWLALLRGELEQGALGIGVLMGYAPRTDPAEYVAVARLAAEAGVPTFTHVRELVESDPTTPIDGSSEVAVVAAETGAHMHHCHVNSTSRRHIDRVLTTLATARAEGARVTVEAYPYGAGSTSVGAYFLAPERLGSWGMTPSSIVLLPSGERVADERRLRQVRAESPATECIVEFLDETAPSDVALLEQALLFPDTVVASDAMPVILRDGSFARDEWPLPPAATHPRTAGTFSKALRMMVREGGAWSWLEAFRRCSYLPARVLDFAPAAHGKGHLGVGADADVVVLDPGRVTDAATYLAPTTPSVGVRHLLVAGTAVIRDGELLTDALPGRPVRAEPA
ncbi:MAG TPA: amidohydrolase family protein [Mycobacteriales bacterium]|nr:amidohydrolase family protein [Mycobacteriales bacterium]